MSPSKKLKVLFIGDIIGAHGRTVCRELLPQLLDEFKPAFVIANGENSAHGYGITVKIYNALMEMGIDALTMGNHMFDKKEFAKDIGKCTNLVRPINYPAGVPGLESLVLDKDGFKLGIFNAVGRTFMPPMDCPFRAADRMSEKLRMITPCVLVDIHAEATSEKCAFAYHLDGRVSAVIGTHTHILTCDEKISPAGTAYITDAGMVGPQDSIIGMQKEPILKRFLTGLPEHFEPAEESAGLFNGVLVTIDPPTGKAEKIEKIVRQSEYISVKK